MILLLAEYIGSILKLLVAALLSNATPGTCFTGKVAGLSMISTTSFFMSRKTPSPKAYVGALTAGRFDAFTITAGRSLFAAVSNATPGTCWTGFVAGQSIVKTTSTPMTIQTLSKEASLGTFTAVRFDGIWTTINALRISTLGRIQ
jgi:hypothetical protein